MSKKVEVTPQYLRDIGNALRYKLNEQVGYFPSEMASAIMRIVGEEVERCPRSEQTTVFNFADMLQNEISFETNAYEEL